jgi:hypothetical protein
MTFEKDSFCKRFPLRAQICFFTLARVVANLLSVWLDTEGTGFRWIP